MRRGYVPYRGDDNPRRKHRRKLVNVSKERRELRALIFFVVIALGVLTYILVIGPPSYLVDGDSIVGLILVSSIVLVILGAIFSFTKFRKGYDIDISDDEEKDNRKT